MADFFLPLHSIHLFLKNAIDTVRRQDHQSTNAHGDRYRSATNQHQLTHCNTLNNYTCRIAMISRDLYSLIGGAPPIAFVKPTFKAKYNDKKKATSWYCFIYIKVWIVANTNLIIRVQQSFTNPARTDDLTLHHWIQESKINQGEIQVMMMDDDINMSFRIPLLQVQSCH